MSDNQTGIYPYDLEPALRDPWLKITPVQWTHREDRAPAYIPGPQPEGTVRVVLDSAGCNGEPADFLLYDDYPVLAQPYRVFDVPAGQYERWRAAKEAFAAMEEEIEAAVSERYRNPAPRPSPGLPL